MALSLSTARYLAPTAFLYDFLAQQYGIFSTPSMTDIHNRNISFFSPQPYFIAAFFFPQQLFQLAWLYRLWRLNPNVPAEKREVDIILPFVPYYALGNVCIGTWMFFWNANLLGVADIFVVVNTAAQLWFVFTQLPPMDTRSISSVLTHVVAKTFAGIGVLDILHNTSAAFFVGDSPGTAVKVMTGVGFAALCAVSDWILGGCLVYDLVALSVGQAIYAEDGSWSGLLGGFAIVSAAVVGFKNWFRPPYVKERVDMLRWGRRSSPEGWYG